MNEKFYGPVFLKKTRKKMDKDKIIRKSLKSGLNRKLVRIKYKN